MDSADDLSRTDDVLQELRDISTMAIEYFDENIAPQLRRLFALQQAENISKAIFTLTISRTTFKFKI